jgi:MFS family permease
MNRIQPQDLKKYRALPWSLGHIALNNFFYTWTFGSSIFPLFLSELGLPKDQIGVLLSFFPFTGLLALPLGSLVTRIGRKRVFLFGYGVRKPIMGSLLLLPWIIHAFGQQTAVVFLFSVILTVAVLRAIAETGFLPWFQEFVPNSVRGKYASVNNIIYTVTSGIALAIASWVIGAGTGIKGYMLLIGLGVIIGLVGVGLMLFVPGGEPQPGADSTQVHAANMLKTRHDRNFVLFLAGTGAFAVGAIMMGSFLPIFVKEQVGIEASKVVLLEITSMVGGAIAGLLAGVIADRLGSRPVLIPGLVLCLIGPFGWFLFTQALAQGKGINATVVFIACGALYFAFGAFSTSASIASSRLLYNDVIPVEKNTAYTAVYYAAMGLLGGLSPILAGQLLTVLADWQITLSIITLNAYALLFLISLLAMTGSLFFYRLVRPDTGWES